jgi:hypothetical protein
VAAETVKVWMVQRPGYPIRYADAPLRDLTTWIAHGWTCVNEKDKPLSPKPSPSPPPSEPTQQKKPRGGHERADPKPVPRKGDSK